MSGESWHKMSVDYKDSKQPDIEEPRMRHIKKKKKKNKRSKHKHEYIPGVYHLSYNGINSNKKHEHITCGHHCKHCGRVENMRFLWAQEEMLIRKFKDEHPDYVEIYLPDNWDYFKDKNIPI